MKNEKKIQPKVVTNNQYFSPFQSLERKRETISHIGGSSQPVQQSLKRPYSGTSISLSHYTNRYYILRWCHDNVVVAKNIYPTHIHIALCGREIKHD